MNTDDLIDFLSSHVEAVDPRRQDRLIGFAVLASFVLALAATISLLGVRPDFGLDLWTSLGFLLKVGFVLALAIIGAVGLSRAARAGGARPGVLWMALLPLGVVWLSAVVELSSMPMADWRGMILAKDWKLCLIAIPLLSLIPLGVLTVVLREAAPTQLPYCGALLGLLAGGIGGLAYASFCGNDTPAYLAVWYAAGVGISTLIGWALGPRLLRW